MKQKIHFTIVFAAVFFSFISCVKEENNDEKYRPAGTQIPFSAVSSYENGDGTRAEYSGQLYGSSSLIERIDWKANDPMTIVYSHGSTWDDAVYTVSSVTTNSSHNEYSDAVVTSSNPLSWVGSENGHTFYGMYPTYSTDSYSSIYHNTVKGRIPDSQPVDANNTLSVTETENNSTITYVKYQPDTKKHGYMVAYLNISGSSESTSVTLPFRPAVTTFEFKFRRKSGDANSKIASFVLSSDSSTGSDLCGDFQFDITGLNNNGKTQWGTVSTPTGGSRGRSITVALPSGGIAPPENGYLDFSILALPITQKKLTLTINYVNDTPTAKHIEFKTGDTWREFEGGKKYVITNVQVPGGDWIYAIDEIQDYSFTGHDPVSQSISVKSYKYTAQNPTTKVAVPWKAQYYDTANSVWVDATTTQFGSGVTGNGGGTGESRTAKLAGDSPSTSITLRQKDINAMKARTPSATTKNGAYDLSKQPRYGILDTSVPTQTTRHTANCYVVSRPGWYKFPCVYGNAISGGDNAVNTSAFAPKDVSATNMSAFVDDAHPLVYWTSNFRNALNNNITNPWIPDDVSSASSLTAKIVWQDSEIVPDNSTYLSYDTKYIYFYITADNIAPGSVIIALTGTVNGATKTLWSWHIWVTNKDLTPVTIGGKSMMDYNLGWMDTADVTETTYNSRSLQFRIIQMETNGSAPAVYEEFTVSQTGGDVVYNKANYGTNPYYQWGRKDPIIPATSNSADKSVTTGRAGNNTTSNTHNLQYHPYDIHSVSDVYDPYYIYCSNADGNQGGTHWGTDADFSVGIQEPYHPILNTYTTGWVGGPFITHGVAEGVYLRNGSPYSEANVATLPVSNYTSGYRLTEFDFYWFNVYMWVSVGGINHNFSINNVTWFVDNQNLNLADFYPDYDGSNYVSRAQERLENCSVASNLWNAVCYQNNVTLFGDGVNQYKTIYDPCPPGFMVPSGAAFNDFPNPVSHTLSGASSADGVTFDGHFFPFTGARVYHSAGNATSWAEDPYHWSANNVVSLSRSSIGSGSYLWVSEHTNISPKMPSKTDPGKYGGAYRYFNINRDTYYSGFDKASFMSFNSSGITKPNSTDGTAGYSMGTAASIRPAVDPKY